MVSDPTFTVTEARSVATVRELSSMLSMEPATWLPPGPSPNCDLSLWKGLAGLVFGQLAALQSLPKLLYLFLGHWRLFVACTLGRLYLGSCRR